MLDLPKDNHIVYETVVEVETSSPFLHELQILDLSFYDILAGGMCSGSSSSGTTDSPVTETCHDQEA